MILQTLRWGAQHGYGIALAIRANSGEVLQVDTGSLYPALHRLERQKLIVAEWKLSENNQRVRVYRLSAAGKKKLVAERSRWAQMSQAIAGVLEPVRRGERGMKFPWSDREQRKEALAEEIASHLKMAASDREARGESPAQAGESARRELGNPGVIQDVTHDSGDGPGLRLCCKTCVTARALCGKIPGSP